MIRVRILLIVNGIVSFTENDACSIYINVVHLHQYFILIIVS